MPCLLYCSSRARSDIPSNFVADVLNSALFRRISVLSRKNLTFSVLAYLLTISTCCLSIAGRWIMFTASQSHITSISSIGTKLSTTAKTGNLYPSFLSQLIFSPYGSRNFSRAVPPRNFIAETITAPGDSFATSCLAASMSSAITGSYRLA